MLERGSLRRLLVEEALWLAAYRRREDLGVLSLGLWWRGGGRWGDQMRARRDAGGGEVSQKRARGSYWGPSGKQDTRRQGPYCSTEKHKAVVVLL